MPCSGSAKRLCKDERGWHCLSNASKNTNTNTITKTNTNTNANTTTNLGHIWNQTEEINLINIPSVIMPPIIQPGTLENTQQREGQKCNQCHFASP